MEEITFVEFISNVEIENVIMCVMADDEEIEVMNMIFGFAKEMIALNISENELALLCAVMLIDHSK